MPYKSVSELPPPVKDNLPAGAQKIFLAAYNSAWEQHGKEDNAEIVCNKIAWAAVKKSYKQDKDGAWVEMAELETVDIPGVELLAPGIWRANTGNVTITLKDLEQIASSYQELAAKAANGEINYEPPIKLGHDENQALLQKDGLPAAGWVHNVRLIGEKLVGDFLKVPRKLAELIKAGAYKKRSAEVYPNYEIGGKKYSQVLKAVSLLGADIPAVKSIADIQALYTQDEQLEVIIFEEVPGMDTEALFSAIDNAVKGKSVPQELTDAIAAFKTKVKAMMNKNMSEQEVSMALDEKKIRTVLKLGETDDVLEAVTKLANKPETDNSKFVSLEEHAKVVTQVNQLTTQLAEKNRDVAVEAAMKAGKLLGAQKKWADAYALSDPKGFADWVAIAPVAVKMGEKGSSGEGNPAIELTEADLETAKKMGVKTEALLAQKKADAEALAKRQGGK